MKSFPVSLRSIATLARCCVLVLVLLTIVIFAVYVVVKMHIGTLYQGIMHAYGNLASNVKKTKMRSSSSRVKETMSLCCDDDDVSILHEDQFKARRHGPQMMPTDRALRL